jgi:hypothetical protein
VFIPDGYVDIVRASLVLGTAFLHGNKVLGYPSPRCVEVDLPEEFERLEFELKRHGSPVLDYLQQHHKED